MKLFPLKIFPSQTSIDFLGKKTIYFILSVFLIVASFGLVLTKGLNFGIDFTGGILVEARLDKKTELSEIRDLFKDSKINDLSLQNIGANDDLLIRIGNKQDHFAKRTEIIEAVKNILNAKYPTIEYRKVDYVGPKVGSELILSGAIALISAFIAIMFYIWFRFEWQFGVGAIVALVHDAILTLGFFSYTQLEFNMPAIAAILTIIGYSINDSVVIFDRIRENLRKYKKKPLEELINISINNNLSRTLTTSLTTILALAALVLMGGEVLKSFSLAALFGVIVGTYSSIYVAAPILIYMNLRREESDSDAQKESA